MLFTELRFFPFLLVAFAVHWLLRRERARKLWLLACSYVFYGAWDWRFLSLLIFSTVVDYWVSLRIVAPGARPRFWLLCSLAVNLGLLGFFKYFGFFVDSAVALLSTLGFHASRPTLEIILPVGISFYTFQTLSYTIDVYRGVLRPTRSALDLALFVAFFPQLVAGPIVRAADFLPQLDEPRRLATVDFRAALMLFLVGFVKKTCVSDNLAPLVDEYFAAPGSYGASAAWAATLYYAIQIYCDFSGYSDMALACAALFGYRLCENFAHPYFATNITAFWRRWHISLSTWLRDYLYIPLGGNRGSKLFAARNLMLTMLLGGLWHGAAWNFVIWGGLHGAALVVHKTWVERVPPGSRARRALALVAPLLTMYFVCVCWIFFRARGLEASTTALSSFVLLRSPGELTLGWQWTLIVPLLALAHWIAYRGFGFGWWRRGPSWAFAAAYALLVTVVIPFVPINAQPFIYFQF